MSGLAGDTDNCSALGSLTIGDNVKIIAEHAFGYCQGLTSLEFGRSITSIAKCAFEGCTGLTKVTIPNSITSIAEGSFQGCSGIDTLTLGEGVRTIGKLAFQGCIALTAIYSHTAVLEADPECRGIFDGVNKSACTLFIPNEARKLYKSACDWADFKQKTLPKPKK